MKKKISFLFLVLMSFLSFSQTLCNSGFAGSYPCSNIDLQSQLTITQLGGSATAEGNDIWGWTDSFDGKEYAIVGLTSHTAFVDITNPTTPIYLGKLPTASVNSIWRDIKVYNNHAFIVSEANAHGMQVFDLTRLRNVVSPPQTFTVDAWYTGFGKCHNIAINEATGYAYAVGSRTFDSAGGPGTNNGGGPHIINIQNPISPTFVSEFNAEGYTHDAQIVLYDGPDTEHLGKEILFGANGDNVAIVDITNKLNPIVLSTFNYTNSSYVHQGWLSEDQKYLLLGDETDEQAFFFNTKTIIIDLSDLDAPVLKNNYFGVTSAIDHNGYVKGDEFYLANYRAGLRLIDLADIENGTLSEKAYFDTFPSSNSRQYNGAWSVYPYFASGNIIISDIEGGLFVVKKAGVLNAANFDKNNNVSLFPNPTTELVTVSMEENIESITIFNLLGKIIFSNNEVHEPSYKINLSHLAKGVYFVKVNNNSIQKLILQ